MPTPREMVYEKLHSILEDIVDLVCDKIEKIENFNSSEDSESFDIHMVLEQLEDYGKYKGIINLNGNCSENYIPVSVAKQIVKGKGLGGVLGYVADGDKEVRGCITCKNNMEYPPPHTCDICTSLDQEEEYDMWEGKIESN